MIQWSKYIIYVYLNLRAASMKFLYSLKGISGLGSSLKYSFKQPVTMLISLHSGPVKSTYGSIDYKA